MKIVFVLLFLILIIAITGVVVFMSGTKADEIDAVQREIASLEKQRAQTTVEETDDTRPASSSIRSDIKNDEPEPESVLEETINPEDVILQEKLDALRSKLIELSTYEEREYKEIVNPSGFINTEAFQLADLVGKNVILLKFTTYGCVNCQHTYPYVIDWYEKYKDDGLAVIAIHTPEFSYERKIENVEIAMQKEGIEFPVVLDNDYATWRAYSNRFWPRMYLIDINGNIVYDHIGEGGYAVTEKKIQKLLAERNTGLGL